MDNNFFDIKPNVNVEELAKFLNVEIKVRDNVTPDQVIISKITALNQSDENSLTFLDNKKYLVQLEAAKPRAIIIDPSLEKYVEHIDIKLFSTTPYYTYARALDYLYISKSDKQGNSYIAETAKIAKTAKIGANCYIEDFVVIGENVVVGEGCYIGSGTVIKYGVTIGNNTKIDNNVTLQYCIISNDCIVHPGVRIGQDGFGFAFANGAHNKLLHIGKVIIGNRVEIGANATIDRGSVNDTIIDDGSKIDNLVQLGHNVKIGKNCIIVAQTGIAGSTEIGDYTVIGGQVGIAGHLKIGAQVQIAAQSGVIRNVENKEIIGGSPAVSIKDWHRQTLAIQKLIKKGQNSNGTA